MFAPRFQRASTLRLAMLAIGWFALFAGFVEGTSAEDPPPAESPPAASPELPAAAEREIDFQRQIAPLLAEHCHTCHGADAEEGGLRLDRRDRALAGGNRGRAIIKGDSAASPLVRYVAGIDDELVMPPEGEERLSGEQVGLLRAWIDQGAKWPADHAATAERRPSDHWSFQAPVRPEPPAVQAAAWVRNPIDAFILARLEREGVAPSPEADRATQLRRLSLDLTGLPPTPEEVDAFLLDNRADAYERQVERLLASPHYGERFARHWLDLARYADSDGYEKDLPRPYAWRYRDWVIAALNADLPFDRFTVEQLAGDLLPDATIEQRVATGFHRNTLTNREGGVDQEEYRAKANVDRVGTTGAVWLGLTLGCAECHSHKYDPISQREFYGIYAFFNESVEKDIPAPLAAELTAYEEAQSRYDAEHSKLAAAVDVFAQNELPSRQAEWESSVQPPPLAQWGVLDFDESVSAGGATFERFDDGSLLVTGENPDKDAYSLTSSAQPARAITALRLDVLADDRLPSRGPGRTNHGNFVLSQLTLSVLPPGEPSPPPQEIALAGATADFAQGKFAAAGALSAKPKSGWAISPRMGESHVAIFELAEPIALAEGSRLAIRLDQQYGDRHTIGRLRLSSTDATPPVTVDRMPDEVIAALSQAATERTPEQQAAIAAYYRTQDAELKRLQSELDKHSKQAPKYPETQAATLVMNDTPPATHIHVRGDFLRHGAEVAPHTLSVLHPLHARGDQPDRLDLARWLVDPANPLTPRVTVNRMWHYFFGRPLVETVNDFGTRGEQPTHPELLDWLATEFIARGWRQKEMHRLIVTSAAYRQSSHARNELADRDPKNLWVARQNRFRVEAEVVRDLTLATSGLLNRTIGGPSVRPPLPSGVAELGYANSVKWPESQGKDRYRRGLYIFFQRTVPYPMLVTFDAPDANVTCTRRERSNTPLQALTLFNGVTTLDAARSLAARVIDECPSDAAARARFALRTCLGREPEPADAARIAELYDELATLCAADPSAASELAGKVSEGQAAETVVEAAAWVGVSRTIMNLDAFVTRE